MALKRFFDSETTVRAVMAIASLVFARLTGRLRCWSLGIRGGGHIGPNARISGTRFIEFGREPFVLENSWIEAVTCYRGAQFAPQLLIGDRLCSSPGLHISAINRIVIGDDCLFGSNVFIADHGHGDYSTNSAGVSQLVPARRPLVSKAEVNIGSGVWLGNNVCVLGACIGNNTVVGANSVVTRNLPANVMAVGAPAKIISIYNVNTRVWEKL